MSEVAGYWVYGAENLRWFLPGMGPGYEHRLEVILPPTTTWSSSNGIGNPRATWIFLVMAVNTSEQELAARTGSASMTLR